jgi:hypothetical protein
MFLEGSIPFQVHLFLSFQGILAMPFKQVREHLNVWVVFFVVFSVFVSVFL